MSLLALVGVFAINASAAQAKWLLLENGVAKSLLALVGLAGLGLMLVREKGTGKLRYSIHCKTAHFVVHIHTVNAKNELVIDGEKLLGTGTAVFLECVFEDSKGVVNKNCEVHSPGKAAGVVEASGSGEGKMEGEKTFAELESAEFAFIDIDGELCPADGDDAEVGGSVTLTVEKAATSEKVHTGALDEKKLFFGANDAFLMPTATEEGPVKGSAELESGQTWAIQLCGLPTPAC